MHPDDPVPALPRDPGNQQRTALQVASPHALSTQLFGIDPAVDDSTHFRDLWHIVLKRKWSLLAFFVIVVVATAIATSMMTPIYRSVISLKIERDAPKVVDYKDVNPVESYYDVDFYKT